MKPQDIHILHLSDLHFEKKVSRPIFELVLRDIVSCLEKRAQRLVVVVTGDLVSQAAFADNADNVVAFFKRLRELLPNLSFDLVEIVPGNHDFERPKIKNDFNDKTYAPKRDEFNEMRDRIYSQMRVEKKESTGVSCIEYCGNKICFVRVDTSAILSKVELRDEIQDEIKKYKIRKFNKKQVEEVVDKRFDKIGADIGRQKGVVVREYAAVAKKCPTGKPLLTIAISHYPLSWLNESGHEKLRETLFAKGLDFVDMWLCGHLHDAQLYYTNDNGRQTTVLMSGIGRDENPQDLLRYSIYTISPLRNACSVQIRAFQGCLLDERQCRNVTLPLVSKEVGAIIPMNQREQEPLLGCFVDKPTIDLLNAVSKRLLSFDRKMSVMAGEYAKKRSYKKAFREFLGVIGSNVLFFFSPTALEGKVDFPNFGMSKNFSTPIWRVHFRRLKAKCYKPLLGAEDDYVAISTSPKEDLRSIKWNSLIRAAYEHAKKTLISSANMCVCERSEKWDDFMTSIPDGIGNKISLPSGETRPLISFGISVKGLDYESSVIACRTLHLLEYIDINNVVSHWVGEFLRLSQKDLIDCLEGAS